MSGILKIRPVTVELSLPEEMKDKVLLGREIPQKYWTKDDIPLIQKFINLDVKGSKQLFSMVLDHKVVEMWIEY